MPTYKFHLYRDGALVAAPDITALDRVSAWAALAEYSTIKGLDYSRASIDSTTDFPPEIVLSQCREAIAELLKHEGPKDIGRLIVECRQECAGYAAGFGNRAIQSLIDEGLIRFNGGQYEYIPHG